MRVLLVGPVPPEVGGRSQGGVASHLWALASYLAEKGHTVGVLGDNYHSESASSKNVGGIDLFGLRKISNPLRNEFLLTPASWKKMLLTKRHFGPLREWRAVISGLVNYDRVLKRFQPDLIHIHHLETRFPFVYYLVEDRIPTLTTVHSTSLIEFSPASLAQEGVDLIQRNLAKARNLIFVSDFLQKRFEAHFPGGLEGKNTAVLHNLVDASLYYPISRGSARERLGLASARPLVLFVGKLDRQKGLDILIKAAVHLGERGLDFQVLVVGSGPQEAELKQLVREAGLSDQVRFEGSKSQSELFMYYNAADVFALPSMMESFGLVFVEAMLCGCPVIGRPDVLQEILPSESCGLYLQSSSPELWAEEISTALGRSWSKEEIHELSAKFTWQVSGEGFETLYQQLTA